MLNSPVDINADSFFYDNENEIAIAEGNVEITLGPRKMRADRVSYNLQTGDADLTGEVRYKDADEQFSFDRVTLNLNTELGILYNGSILINTNNYRIFGEKIEKTGEQSYRIQKGAITTCPCDDGKPDWELGMRHADVLLDGYAFSKDVTMRAKGVPVFWLPYGVFPVKLTRQSGLLFPSFSVSRLKGTMYTVPYYWAINRWSDATVTVDVMSARGVRPEVEYRFVLNRESEGEISGNFINDKKTHEDRWRIHGRNTFHSGDWTANAEVEIPSDSQYYVDFAGHDMLRMLRSLRQTFSTGFVGLSGENSSQQLSVTWVEEMERNANDNTLQRLPEYQADLLLHRTPVGGVEASGEMSATYFYRDSGEKAARARGSMALSRTFVPFPSVSLTPYVSGYALGVRHEQGDSWNNTGFFVPVMGVHGAAEAQRSFLQNGSGFVHVLGADVNFQHVQNVDQDNMPFHDRWSRLGAQDQVVFSVSQSLLRMRDSSSPAEIASMILQWAYDFRGGTYDSPYIDPLSPFVRTLRNQIDLGGGKLLRIDKASDIYGKITLRPIKRWSLEGETLFDPVDTSFSMAALGFGWERDTDHRFRLGYRISSGLAEDVRASFAWRLLRFLRLRADLNYSLKNSEVTNGSASFAITPKSDCWSIEFATLWNTYPRDPSYRVIFGMKGIGASSK